MNIEHIQLLRGTAEALASVNPVLLAGELGLETDTGKFKFGDGTSAWNSLSYAGGGGSAELPTDGVYVIKNGAYVPATVVDMTADWQPSVETEEAVLGTNNTGIWNMNSSGYYEIECFIYDSSTGTRHLLRLYNSSNIEVMTVSITTARTITP